MEANQRCQISRLYLETLNRYLEELLEIDRLCFAHMAVWERGNFQRDLDSKWELSGIFIEERVQGYLVGSRYGDSGHLNRVAVHPAYQGGGIGKQLVTYFLSRCRDKNIFHVTLEFEERQRVKRFYAKFGFLPLSPEETIDYLEKKDKMHAKDTYKVINTNGYRYVYSKTL